MWLKYVFSLVVLSSTVLSQRQSSYYYSQPSIDTALEMKCQLLNAQMNTLFMDSTCYITTKEHYQTTYDTHIELGKHCTALPGYRAGLAIIQTREQINALLAANVVESQGRYYVGAKQSPRSDCGDHLCTYSDPQHHKNWYFFDPDGNKVTELNADLWLSLEPDNQGPNPPEYVVTLEHLDDTRLGFNDVTGEQDFQLMCQYQDVMVCPEGFTLIRDMCYMAVILEMTIEASAAEEYCESNYANAHLASIHNDCQNDYLADLAREAANYTYRESFDEVDQWGPFLIGLQFVDSYWQWTDGSKVNYYRWFAEEGGSMNMLYAPNRNGYTYLQTTTNANSGEGGFGYWANRFTGRDQSIPVRRLICEAKPNIVLPTNSYTRSMWFLCEAYALDALKYQKMIKIETFRLSGGFGYWANRFTGRDQSIPVRRLICEAKPNIVLPTNSHTRSMW